MRNIKNFNTFVLEQINIADMQVKPDKIKRLCNKITNEIGFNLYLINTFSVAITVFYPVIENLIKYGKFNIEVNEYNIVLLTICAFTVLLRENKEKVKLLFKLANSKGISNEDIDKFINQISTIRDIFYLITKNTSKVVSAFVDMLAYTALLVPFMCVLNTLITEKLIDTEYLINSLPALEISLGSMGLKLFLNRIVHRLDIINSNRFQNIDNVKPLLVNDELK
jgi:hypothetical protein